MNKTILKLTAKSQNSPLIRQEIWGKIFHVKTLAYI